MVTDHARSSRRIHRALCLELEHGFQLRRCHASQRSVSRYGACWVDVPSIVARHRGRSFGMRRINSSAASCCRSLRIGSGNPARLVTARCRAAVWITHTRASTRRTQVAQAFGVRCGRTAQSVAQRGTNAPFGRPTHDSQRRSSAIHARSYVPPNLARSGRRGQARADAIHVARLHQHQNSLRRGRRRAENGFRP